MQKINNLIFKISGILTLCGIVMLVSNMFAPDHLELISRILLAAGCLAAIASILFRSKLPMSACNSIGKKTIDTAKNTFTFRDVAANYEAKQSLSGLVDYLKNTDKYSSFGARMPSGVLLYGPPGTGKTLLARALAGEAGVPFFAMSGSDFVQMYVGVGASRVRDLFANARKAGKCVIFIDEIDALGKRRSDTASEERDQTLNALLSEMSGFVSRDGIIVLAATNRIESLDPALIRPGRFDRHIEVGLPNVSERQEILELHSRNKPLGADINLEKIAHETCSFSGAALEALLNEAAIMAARRSSPTIDAADIDRAYYKAVTGEDGSAAPDPEERYTIALHEAGHALSLKLLMPSSHLKRVSILSSSRGAAGYNLAIPKEHVLFKKEDFENQIVVLLAGRCAEVLMGGEAAISSGASGDLARAAEIAGAMIMDMGMGDEPAVSCNAIRNICGSSSRQEEKCREILNDCYKKAYELLEANISLLLKITELLIEKETLDENLIESIFVGIKTESPNIA